MPENRGTTPPTGAGIFSAADLKRRMVEREAAKAAEEMRHAKEQEEKQKAVMKELHKPLDRTAEQLMQVVDAARKPCGRARTKRSAGLSFSKCDVQRSRPKDQQL
jgi:hypothetical protein